ncbi:MAG: ABC transporter substrate-binding protein [Brevundimonas sp.]|uniref:ABC transporter substrate-binding protein n=1 Tax=Brevundimonas sp. TaxID=1871086 RepID=UPI00391C681F
MKAAVAALLAVLGASEPAQARPLRIMALDQCADQYVLALRPDADVILSPRADDPDSWMREAARGRRQLRPTLEAATLARPDVVVRYWGGDARLLAAVERGGARTASIQDANDFEGVRANLRVIGRALDALERAEALISRMDRRLAQAGQAAPRTALYLTPGGFTAGKGTLIDAMMRAARLTNLAAAPGFTPVSVERLVLAPPAAFILGFYDQIRADWRGPGRHPVLRAAAQGRVAARIPAAALTCPAWFAADAAAMMTETAR